MPQTKDAGDVAAPRAEDASPRSAYFAAASTLSLL